MNEIVTFSVLLVLGTLGMFIWQRSLASWERRYVWLSFAAHAVSAVAMVLLTIYFFGGGDLLAYQALGATNASLLSTDFDTYAPDMMRLILGRATMARLPFSGTSTGSMVGLSTWLHPLLWGSLYGKCLFIALLGVPSKYYIYKSLAAFFHSSYHRVILLSCMLLPSTVFWTSGMLKEPVAMLGMGALAYGSMLIITRRRRLKGISLVLMGGFVISIFKAYILFPWIIASAIGYYWQRQVTSNKNSLSLITRPFSLIVLLLVGVAGVWLLGQIFPRYSIQNITAEIAALQDIGQRTSGGSNYTISSDIARSQSAQLALLPLGLFFSLFRPFFFEVRNAALLLNALETTAFLVLWARMIMNRGVRNLVQLILKTPGAIYAVMFVLLF